MDVHYKVLSEVGKEGVICVERGWTVLGAWRN